MLDEQHYVLVNLTTSTEKSKYLLIKNISQILQKLCIKQQIITCKMSKHIKVVMVTGLVHGSLMTLYTESSQQIFICHLLVKKVPK